MCSTPFYFILTEISYNMTIQYRNQQVMNRWNQCIPKTCLFQCGGSELKELVKVNDEYGLYDLPRGKTQMRAKMVPMIQLGPGSTKTLDSRKKTEGKISIRQSIKSIERGKEKKLSLKKNSFRNSLSSSLSKNELITKSTPSQNQLAVKDRSPHNDYQQFYGFDQPQQSVMSTDYTVASVRIKINSDESNKKCGIFKQNDFIQQNSRTIEGVCIIDLNLRENSVPMTPARDYSLRLGQNLPTLRSEGEHSNSQLSGRSEVLKY